jgi:hypothetical protein
MFGRTKQRRLPSLIFQSVTERTTNVPITLDHEYRLCHGRSLAKARRVLQARGAQQSGSILKSGADCSAPCNHRASSNIPDAGDGLSSFGPQHDVR